MISRLLKRFFKKDQAPEIPASHRLQQDAGTATFLPIKSKYNFRNLPFRRYLPMIMTGMLGLMAADLTAIYLRSYMIPSGVAPTKKQDFNNPPYKSRSEYGDILARNIFNSDGIIPEIKAIAETGTSFDPNGPARESALPLQLMGTIVHANPGKSVATIQANANAEKILPYIANDDIEGMATLLKVERKKVFIRNLSNGTNEFIQIKDESIFAFKKGPGVTKKDGPVEKESEDTFAISKSDLEAQMANLPDLLTQARAIPNFAPGGSKVDGFRIVEVADGSLFTKLGIKPGDVIKGVDGDPIDSPSKAMEMYNALRTKSQLRLQMERDGRPITFTYNIR